MRPFRPLRVVSTALAAVAAVCAPPGAAQTSGHDSSAATVPVDERAARVPFGPGERLTYKLKVGILGAGEGRMEVHAVDTVRGRRAYRASMSLEGGLGPLKVDDELTSWFDVRNLQSWRYIRDLHEVTYKSYRHFEMYPERKRWEREDNDEFGTLGSSIPLDDVAFVYFLRTLPLEVGKTYTLNRYFKEDGNPVVIRVVRRDRRKVDAGEFETIVVKPIIQTDGMFGEGGDAELHFTDDERRILVYLKTDIPNFPGSLTLHLREIHEGLPLHPKAREAALARRELAPVEGGR